MVRDLPIADRQAIDRTLALHGHIFDRGELDRLEEIFTPEIVYDLSDVGVGTFEGLEAMADGSVASVTHLDTLRRDEGTWRISRRVIQAQRAPLGGLRQTP